MASVEVAADILDAARVAGGAAGRSAEQQISFWARLGKQIEDSDAFHADRVAQVLAGDASYDRLGEVDRAAVRAAWDEAVPRAISCLDYQARFRAAGESWSEADESGNLILRGSAGDD